MERTLTRARRSERRGNFIDLCEERGSKCFEKREMEEVWGGVCDGWGRFMINGGNYEKWGKFMTNGGNL